MTEADAREKWCPSRSMASSTMVAGIVALSAEAGLDAIKKSEEASGERCIASDCMMWRTDRQLPSGHGYCGLAGKPETAEVPF